MFKYGHRELYGPSRDPRFYFSRFGGGSLPFVGISYADYEHVFVNPPCVFLGKRAIMVTRKGWVGGWGARVFPDHVFALMGCAS